MSEITTIGLDLAKHVFQVHGIDAQGTTVLRKCADKYWRSSAAFHAVWCGSLLLSCRRRGGAACVVAKAPSGGLLAFLGSG
jgi:hypothetical protein